MQRFVLDVVEAIELDDFPMPEIAQAGGAFDWLAEEPEVYTDADLLSEP